MINRRKGKVKQPINPINGWDKVISSAERQLAAINQRAAGLRQVIEDFKQMKKEGMPWPGDTAGTGSESVPANRS